MIAPPAATVAAVLDAVDARPPTLGGGRLVCVDGPAGSGKTTLARAVVSAARRADRPVTRVAMDDLYEGWEGLPGSESTLLALLEPLGRGEPGRYRRHDWVHDRPGELREVRPCPLILIEGVGSGVASLDALRTLLVWVEAPRDLRRRRGLERDGADVAPAWDRWTAGEDRHFAHQRTAARADLRVDGATGLLVPGRPST